MNKRSKLGLAKLLGEKILSLYEFRQRPWPLEWLPLQIFRIGPTVATAPLAPLLDEVRSQLVDGIGAFRKVYLYIGSNEGPLHVIYSLNETRKGLENHVDVRVA